MKRKRLASAVGFAVIALTTACAMMFGSKETTTYRTAVVTRGNVESVVTSTGQLQAIETVEVGTQVSGQIAELLVDFNDHVKKGQLLARIDPAILLAEVRSAEADLQRNKAELDQADRASARSDELYAQKVVSDSEHESATYAKSIAAASYASAEISLERAKRNLGYSEIRAPIDGIVVERTVESGQTVAASTSAPKLFVIARDLTKLEILASVDESDIGKIHEGQPARFTVQAFGDRAFTGTVRQVRLQSTATENVVSYTVVVAVDNPDGALLPGMTATAEFVVDREPDVLKVANTALRFRPATEAAATAAATSAPAAGTTAARPAGANAGRTAGAARTPRAIGQAPRQSSGTLWTIGADGAPKELHVRVGLTDGQYTAVSGEGVEEGLKVISGTSSAAQTAAASANPFQAQGQSGQGGPPRSGGF